MRGKGRLIGLVLNRDHVIWGVTRLPDKEKTDDKLIYQILADSYLEMESRRGKQWGSKGFRRFCSADSAVHIRDSLSTSWDCAAAGKKPLPE